VKRLYVFISDLLTAKGNKRNLIDSCFENGAYGIRFFLCHIGGRGKNLQPFKRVGWYEHPEVPGVKFPVYDLRIPNPTYYRRLKRIIKFIKANDGLILCSLHDFCSLKGNKTVKYYHPFVCSVQAFETSGGVWGEQMKRWHARYFREIIEFLNAQGVKYEFEGMSEYDAKDWDDATMIDWHKWAIDELVKLGISKCNIVASAMRNYSQIASQAGYYSIHGIVRPNNLGDFDYKPHPQLIISGDGGTDGEGTPDAKGRKGVSLPHSKQIAHRINHMNYAGYEYMDRGLWNPDNDNANLDNFDPSILAAMAKIFSKA